MFDPVSLEHPQVLEVEIDSHFDWDTHSTGGEHAQKESGAWRTFLYNLQESGGQLPEHVEDPQDHYFDERTGIFYRAYSTRAVGMVAGWAASRTEGRGLTVDAMWAQSPYATASRSEEQAVNSLVAGGLAEILQRRVFRDYCGIYGLPALKYLSLPFANIQNAVMPQGSAHPYKQNFGVKRSLVGFAIPTDEGYVVPLPNRIATPPREDPLDEIALGEFKEAMPENFDGAIRYSTMTEPDIIIEEFYRRRTHIGTLLITYGDVGGPMTKAMTADGRPLDLPPVSWEHQQAANRVALLKSLAENDSEVASLILPG